MGKTVRNFIQTNRKLMIIYFTGIDGSGKSTIIKELENRKIFGEKYITTRGGYVVKLMKPISNIARKKKVKSSINYNYISKSDYNRWKDFKIKLLKSKLINSLLYAIQSFDYYLQILKLEKNYLNDNFNSTIILDRYIYDFLIAMNIFYGDKSNSYWYKKLEKKLVLVDYIFFIDTNCKSAFSRKDDIPSLEYLEERRLLYLKTLKNVEKCYNIDNNGNIEETINQIEKILLK
tara:strand:+ start:5735 stop:6433 length:699 start_codon:yes stop_codon:yes gene_type:complete